MCANVHGREHDPPRPPLYPSSGYYITGLLNKSLFVLVCLQCRTVERNDGKITETNLWARNMYGHTHAYTYVFARR